MIQYLFEIIGWWLLAIVKFLFTPSAMIAAGYTYLEVLVVSASGACMGVLIFFYAGERIFSLFKSKKPGKIFTPGRRRIIRLKSRFGIKGLMLFSAFLSVPISSILAARYFRHERSTVPMMMIGFGVWAVILTTLSWAVRYVFS
jgi:hypothetical protein